MLPFITSSVSLMPEREEDGRTDSATGPVLRTQHPAERFVVLSDSPYHSSLNAAGAEVSSVARSLIPDPPVMTTAVATTIVANTYSVLVPRAGHEPVYASIFTDSTSAGTVGPDIAGPSQPLGTELSTDTFFVSQDMNSETLHQIYVPKWNVVNESALDDPDMCRSLLLAEFNVGAARQTCLSVEVRMRLEHELRGRKKFEGKCAMLADLLKGKDAEIASLKAQLSLKEAEAAEAIRLCGQVASVEAAEATRVKELNALKERNSSIEEEKNGLERTVAALESADAAKVTELASLTAQTAKLTQELSELGLSCDELSIKASSLEVERDRLVGQVSMLEAGRRWILSRGMKLVVMKCLQSSDYLADLGEAIGRAVDKANYVSVINALRAMNFPRLAQLESQRDASMVDNVGLLRLEGSAAKTPEVNQLQPSPEKLMLPIHHPEDQVVIGETSLSFSLDVVHDRVKRIRGDAASRRLSLSDALVPLIEPLSAENLVGEASTSRFPVTATTTTFSTTFIQTNSVPPISVAGYEVLDVGLSTEVPSPPKIVFGKEELETTPEHTTVD
ncbi:hypothetical protein Tco_0911180 [Tanacetum coccineum]|uniref:Uncharacterized protein n=1 Tax=Tanacetum coccineum TaxID=301880 RepID=A0ABQ5CV23_9ASTR